MRLNLDISRERGIVSGLSKLISRLAAHTGNENEIGGMVLGHLSSIFSLVLSFQNENEIGEGFQAI